MRSIVICLYLLCLGSFAGSTEKEIANDAIILASNFLSKNAEDPDGLAYYKLAKALTPESDMVMLMGGYMKKGLSPKALPGGKPKDELLKEIKGRGVYLIKKRFKKNRDVGNIALLLLSFADKQDPDDEDVLYAITYLNTYGFTDTLDALFDQEFDIGVMAKSGKRPTKAVDIDLSKEDKVIAEKAMRLGQMLLSADSGSDIGIKWARMGHHLDPSDHKGLFTLKQLLRGMKVKPVKVSLTSKALANDMIERAEHFVKKAEKDELAAHLAQLYFKTADAILPNQKKVLIGLMRLEQMDLRESLDSLLNKDLSTLAGTAGDDDDDDDGDDDDDDNDNDNVKVVEKPAYDGKKLRPKANTHRKNLDRRSDYSYYELEERTLWGKLDNYTGQDVDNLVVETYMIGSDARRTEFFIAAKGVFNGVSVRTRMWYDIPKTRASFYKKGKYNYYCWLIIVKDSSGKILNMDSNKTTMKKIGDKITTFSAAAHSSSSYYYYSGTRFDKDGNVLQNSSLYY